jgi:DNA-binding MarR family transcriptional regulator
VTILHYSFTIFTDTFTDREKISSSSRSTAAQIFFICIDNCCIYNYSDSMSKSVPSNLEEHLGYWLRCLSNFVSQSFAERLARQDISVSQWVVLRTLYDSSGVTLNEAAAQVGVDKSTLSRMVERLVQRGLVNRAEGDDRRSVGLALTPTGKKLVPQLARLADENDAAFFNMLAPKQRAEFLATIKQLLTANGWEASQRGRDRME